MDATLDRTSNHKTAMAAALGQCPFLHRHSAQPPPLPLPSHPQGILFLFPFSLTFFFLFFSFSGWTHVVRRQIQLWPPRSLHPPHPLLLRLHQMYFFFNFIFTFLLVRNSTKPLIRVSFLQGGTAWRCNVMVGCYGGTWLGI